MATLGLLLERLEELRSRSEALALRRERYAALFTYAPAACIVTDPAGTIQEVNPAAAALLGRQSRHLPRKPLAALVGLAERRAFRGQLAALRERAAFESSLAGRKVRLSVRRSAHALLWFAQ
jgi:PAS domain S-box-containing protein